MYKPWIKENTNRLLGWLHQQATTRSIGRGQGLLGKECVSLHDVPVQSPMLTNIGAQI